MNAKALKVLDEVKEAYMGANFNASTFFKASIAIPAEDAVDVLMAAFGVRDPYKPVYNGFCCGELSELPAGSMVFLAREYSPCAYVKLPKGKRFGEKKAFEAMNISEYNVKDGMIRLWWD